MAESATVGILRALLIADTAEFEQKLGDATKEVGKLESALKDVGGQTVGALAPTSAALDQAGGAAATFAKQLLGVEPAAAAAATETAAVAAEASTMAGIVESFTGGLLGPELGAIAAAFAEIVLPITLAAAALGAFLAWIYKWTDVGPMLAHLWADVTSRVEDLWAAVEEAVTALGELTYAFQDLIPGLSLVKLGIIGLQLTFDIWITSAIADVRQLTDDLAVLSGVMGKPVIPEPVVKLGDSFLRLPELALNTPEDFARAQREITEQLREQAREREKIRRQEAAAYQRLVSGAYALSTQHLIDDQQRLTREIAIATKTFGGLSEKGLQEVITRSQQYLAAGLKLTPAIQNVRLAHLDLLAALIPVNEGTKELLAGSRNLLPVFLATGKALGGLSDELAHFSSIVNTDKGLANLGKILGQGVPLSLPPPKLGAWAQTFADFATTIPALFADALTRGGGWADLGRQFAVNLAGTLATTLAQTLSEQLKGVLGKVFKDLVPVIGPLIGGLTDALFGKLFGSKGRDLVVQFADSMGGFDALHKQLQTLGAEGERLWVRLTQGVGRNNPKEAQAAIDAINAALGRQQTLIDTITSKYGVLTGAVERFGDVLPQSVRDAVNELLRIGGPGLTDELRAGLQGLAQEPSWQTLQRNAEELGIDLAALGPSFQQARLGDIAFGYQHQLEMFAESGADMNGVLRGMADELSTVYQTALTTGAKLPETLRPYMQQLVDAGLLLDANGNKVEALDDVFAEMDDTALKDIVDVLKDIKELLERALPHAATRAAEGVEAAFAGIDIRIPYRFEGEDAPTFDRPEIGLQGGTHGRFVDWGDGTDVTLHGLERVMTPDELGGGPINITVVSQLDGREVARNQVKYIPRELVLSGV